MLLFCPSGFNHLPVFDSDLVGAELNIPSDYPNMWVSLPFCKAGSWYPGHFFGLNKLLLLSHLNLQDLVMSYFIAWETTLSRAVPFHLQ